MRILAMTGCFVLATLLTGCGDDAQAPKSEAAKPAAEKSSQTSPASKTTPPASKAAAPSAPAKPAKQAADNTAAPTSNKMAKSVDAKVPGTDFNATGQIPCARNAGQPMAQCKFGVKRVGGGTADVTVFWPDSGSRVLFFEKGKFKGADISQADGNAKVSAQQNSDLWIIKVGDQRFEVPDAVVSGG